MKTSMKFSSQLANAVKLKISKIIGAPMEIPETEANIEIYIEKENYWLLKIIDLLTPLMPQRSQKSFQKPLILKIKVIYQTQRIKV